MEELGNTVPMAEGMVDAENASNKSPLSDVCLNCGARLTGLYCSECGQKNIPRRQALGELAQNFLGSFFSYESKFFRTLKKLLFRPGYLALEYNAGKRESYYHPARMYVFVSFIYFLLFFSLPGTESQGDNIQDDDSELVDSDGSDWNFKFSTEDYDSREEYDSIQATLPANKKDGWILRKMQYRSFELRSKYQGNGKNFGKDFGSTFAENTPKILFFLLPVFALILKLLYVRHDYYYSEHLVLSIYFYNFSFVTGIITLLFSLIPFLDWLPTIAFILIMVYLLIAMKNMYRQRWPKTVLKFFLLSMIFSVCMGVGLLANAMLTLLIF
ncbi:MAG: DUF3667 domain-containing protein [Cyclobacteriaceae bacterium]|nr:DUF3667 domain-containing protein [Cyclobacteriaceae bacterium]